MCLQIIKAHVVSSCRDQQLAVFDPTLGSLGNQMRKLSLDEWLLALEHLLRVLFFMCRRVQSIQELILENIDRHAAILHENPLEPSVPVPTDRTSTGCEQQQQHLVPSIIVEQEDEGEEDLEEEMKDLLRGSEMNVDGSAMTRLPSTLSLEVMASEEPELGASSMPHSQSMACVEYNETICHNANVLGATVVEGLSSVIASTPAALLSMPCRNLAQVFRFLFCILTDQCTVILSTARASSMVF
ncbi:unnamed protein product [Toxocara canis]|uniref:Neurobeachin-like n=1 Tax=Toxocara canis TaxID=6265 RepID=A0A183U728_TOXCA|nr:unnamed protein product [Toxocara canis]